MAMYTSFYMTYLLDIKKEFNLSGRIVGGAGRIEGEDPVSWNVAFMYDNRDVFCGGVLLSHQYVLTAAHCRPYLRFDGYDLVLVGAKKKTDELVLTLTETYFVYEEYEEFESADMGTICINDFMLVMLRTPNILEMGCRSNFVRLPKKGLTEHQLRGVTLTAVGWGSVTPVTHQQILDKIQNCINYKIVRPDRMIETDLSLVPSYICQKRYQQMLSEWGSVHGIRPDPKMGIYNDKPGRFDISDINFSQKSGKSMLCASMCIEENLASCTEKHGHKGACMGDSGCKYWIYDFNSSSEKIYFIMLPN